MLILVKKLENNEKIFVNHLKNIVTVYFMKKKIKIIEL